MADSRTLRNLISVGPATEQDLHLLGIFTVDGLAGEEPRALYARLCELTGVRQDPCVEDVFAAAIAQARDPDLPKDQCQWFYYSRLRKGEKAAGRKAR